MDRSSLLRAWVGVALAGVCLSTPPAHAAPPSEHVDAPNEARVREGRHSLEAAFFGAQLTRPGGSLGYSYRALESRKKLHALVVGGDLGSYHWARHSVGLFVLPRIGWRGRHRSGLQGEANLHLGYLHELLPSRNYEVVGGEVREAPNRGYPALMVGPTLGIGWYVARIGLTPFVRTGAYWQYPVADQALVRLSLTVGVEVRL
jgi:hypothetical protein